MFNFRHDAYVDGCCGFNVCGDGNKGCGCLLFGGDEFSSNDYGGDPSDYRDSVESVDCFRCNRVTERVVELGDDVGF